MTFILTDGIRNGLRRLRQSASSPAALQLQRAGVYAAGKPRPLPARPGMSKALDPEVMPLGASPESAAPQKEARQVPLM